MKIWLTLYKTFEEQKGGKVSPLKTIKAPHGAYFKGKVKLLGVCPRGFPGAPGPGITSRGIQARIACSRIKDAVFSG